MIPFQFRTFFRVVTARTNLDESSLKRKLFRFAFTLGFPLFELFNALHLSLDRLFFNRYKDQEVRHPVFIIGNPRSGTTFLHRVLARDEANFTATRLWQLIFPSLSSQYLFRFIARIDRLVGGPLAALIDAGQRRLMKGADKIHKARLEAPEEDEGLFIHAFASEFLALLFPMDEWQQYKRFDDMPEKQRGPLMQFYKECLQRHLYQDGRGRQFLSKNPLFCTKIKSIYETFPGARVVYLVRNPAEAICSLQNMVAEIFKAQGMGMAEGQSLRNDGLLEWSLFCYQHALEQLDRAPQGSAILVRYEELIADPRGTVERIYKTLGIPMTPEYQAILQEEAEKASKYRSEHQYSLERFNLTHEEVESMASFVYERFGYPRLGKVRLSSGS